MKILSSTKNLIRVTLGLIICSSLFRFFSQMQQSFPKKRDLVLTSDANYSPAEPASQTVHYHPNAPITELSNYRRKLLSIPDLDYCKNWKAENVTIVIVLNRLKNFIQRANIRATYGNSSSFLTKVNWSWHYLFLTGKPVTVNEHNFIQEESRDLFPFLA